MSTYLNNFLGTIRFTRHSGERLFETRSCRCIIGSLGRSEAVILCPKHDEQVSAFVFGDKGRSKDNFIACMPADCDCYFAKWGQEICVFPCSTHEKEIIEMVVSHNERACQGTDAT